MTAKDDFSQNSSPAYMLGLANEPDRERVGFLNSAVALLPKTETNVFPARDIYDLLQANRSLVKQPTGLTDGLNAAFKTLFSALDNIVVKTEDRVSARIGAQASALDAFNTFNKAIDAEHVSPLMISKEGRAVFAERNRIRDVYAGMQHGGLSGTTYAPSTYK